MVKKLLLAISILGFIGVASTMAEERFGVPVYPNAKDDAATSRKLKNAMGIEAACFQTTDSVVDVTAFYSKQSGLRSMRGTTDKGAMFKSDQADVTIQNPWMDLVTGRMVKTTLISIVKKP